jgi:V/A-type H+-transporting ATPase subunit I
MKQIEMTILVRDVDPVIEFLGRRSLMHFTGGESSHDHFQWSHSAGDSGDSIDSRDGINQGSSGAVDHIREILDRLRSAAVYLGQELPEEPDDDTVLPQEAEVHLADNLVTSILGLSMQENEQAGEKKKLEETLNEAQAFSKLNAPFSDLDQLSYLALRVGRLDPRRQE